MCLCFSTTPILKGATEIAPYTVVKTQKVCAIHLNQILSLNNLEIYLWQGTTSFVRQSVPQIGINTDHSNIVQEGLIVMKRDREEDVPECSGPGISRIFSGNIRFPGNGIRERRPLDYVYKEDYFKFNPFPQNLFRYSFLSKKSITV